MCYCFPLHQTGPYRDDVAFHQIMSFTASKNQKKRMRFRGQKKTESFRPWKLLTFPVDLN